MEVTEKVHLVHCKQSHPNDFLGPVGKMSDHGKADLGAEGSEEYKKIINGKFQS